MNITKKKFILYLIFVITQTLSAQDYFWTGNGDGIDFFQEANWANTSSGLPPEDATINPSEPITQNLFLTCNAIATSAASKDVNIASQTPEIFDLGPNENWPYAFAAAAKDDGNNGAQQTFEINITSLPSGEANYSVVKTVANGNWYFGNPQTLSLGFNRIHVTAVHFNRAVKFKFSSGDIVFDSISLNGTSIYSTPNSIVLDPSNTLHISNATLVAHCISGGNLILNENAYVQLSDPEPLLNNIHVNLNADMSWLRLEKVNPTQVFDKYSSLFFVSDIRSEYPIHIRFDNYYDAGTVIRTQNLEATPLTIYSGENSTGTSAKIFINEVFSGASIPNQLNNNIASFYLKRGFMLTLASNPDGTGKSKVFIASEEDLEVASLPDFLANNVSFIRIVPWNWVSKKGTGGDIQGMDNTWYYRWTNIGEYDLQREYTPMAWGYGGADESDDINTYQSKYKATHVLAFNEPDNCNGQSGAIHNMCDVDTALGIYKNLMKTGLRLVSPACRQEGALDWLRSFNELAIENDIRIDVIALHWYDWGANPQGSPNGNPVAIFNRFKNYLEQVYQLYALPIWITEFNANKYRTEEVNRQFMELAIPYLEGLDYVERYAWFQPLPTGDNSAGTADFYDESMNLTEIGEFYKNHSSTPSIPDFFHAGPDNLDDRLIHNHYRYACNSSGSLSVLDSDLIPDNSELNIYPNPVSDKINISMNEAIHTIDIYSIHGIHIKTALLDRSIHISNLKKGIYVLKVNNHFKKFIKH